MNHFAEASLIGADLRDASLEGANLQGCKISNAMFDGARIQRACFFNAKGQGADFSRVDGIAADFSMADLCRARFSGANLERANFTETNLSGADFTETELVNTIFAHSEMEGALLAAEMVGTIFVNIDLSKVKLLSSAITDNGVHIDLRTVRQLVNARNAGLDIQEQLNALARAGVSLPLDLGTPQIVDDSNDSEGNDSDGMIDLVSEFSIPLGVESSVLDRFKEILRDAEDERPCQEYLELHPEILLAAVAANHRGWVFPQQRLGSEYVADFLACGLSSAGRDWLAIELESPRVALFNKDGSQSKQLRHAIDQVLDWRRWIAGNRDYARRPRAADGLGLQDIEGEVPGLILIGRSDSINPETMEYRRRISRELRIQIRSYDYLIRACTTPLAVRASTAPLTGRADNWDTGV